MFSWQVDDALQIDNGCGVMVPGFLRGAVSWAVAMAMLVGSTPAQAVDIDQWLEGNLSEVVALYRQLHQAPELSLQEKETSARLAQELRTLGIEVTERVGGYGVVGVLKNGEGKTLMWRADMDALPVVEQTGLEYASKVRVTDERGATVGTMHACGHDVHMANLIGAARYLAANREGWSGTIVLLCQPAEERGAGAQAMLADGLLARFPRPDFAVALHVFPDLATGKVGYRAGYAMANVDSVDIKIKGRGGHGAYPQETIDPIVIAARLVLDLQTIVSREIKPIEPAVVTVGSIHGGTKHNIIGDECHLQLTVRSYSPQVRKQLQEAIRRKALAAAASSGAPEPDIDVSEGTPSLFNDPGLTSRVVAALEESLGKENVEESEPSMGGEDFGRYGLAGVPICMFRLGAISEKRLKEYAAQGSSPPSLHSPLFYPDAEEALRTGIRATVNVALELLPNE